MTPSSPDLEVRWPFGTPVPSLVTWGALLLRRGTQMVTVNAFWMPALFLMLGTGAGTEVIQGQGVGKEMNKLAVKMIYSVLV